MNNPEAVPFKLSELPSPADTQFRASRLTVWNWGTFSRRHTMEFAWDGHLIVGPSGSGKSTLQDAMSALLVPPAKVRFNAAAEEGERGGRDRTLMSYVRGAWADRGEEGSRETAKQFLRGEATWSAIALEYRNRQERVVTLVRLLWSRGAGTAANLNKHFMVVDGEFDLNELNEFDGERRTLRQKLNRAGIRHHDESFASYQEHWCAIFGIEDPSVLDLLHKTQSTKSLGDLNAFLREFMLSEPETFDKAKALIEEFIDLEEAHRAVVTARRQVEVLTPARVAHADHERTEAAIAGNDAMEAAMPALRSSMDVGLLEGELTALQRGRTTASARRGEVLTLHSAVEERIEALNQQRLEHGGASIVEIERRLEDQVAERVRRSKAREKAELLCQSLGWTLADTSPAFAEQVTEAKELFIRSEQQAASRDEERDRLKAELRERTTNFAELQADVRSLEFHPSNIPRPAQDLRTRLCEATGVPAVKAVFVGELIQVREADRAHWGPAAEHLLRAFALDLLIDEGDDRKVARWVEDTNLRGKLSYQPIRTGGHGADRDPDSPDSILNKLEVKPGHPFAPWIRRTLLERFDYLCVDSPAELTRGEKRITAQGQIRHRGRRTVKDDSRDLTDKRNWVLGFDNRDKLERMKGLAATAGADLAHTDAALKAVDADRQRDMHRVLAAGALADTDWADIDVGSQVQRVQAIENALAAQRASSPQLLQVDAELATAKTERTNYAQEAAELQVTINQANEREPKLEEALVRARIESATLPASMKDSLMARLPAGWAPTRASVPDAVQTLGAGLQRETRTLTLRLATLKQTITSAFAEFLREWPEEAAALQAELAFAPDFFAKLERIEQDGLPGYEQRFLDLLQTQSTRRLSELSRLLAEAKREIATRLVDVNDALRLVPYNPDSRLEIESVDLNLPDVREFRETLAQMFAQQRNQTDDPVEAERRFELLRKLVTRLREDDAWRAVVLDVRRHVQFMAIEREHGTNREIERYSGSAGKSGGQRQKLTATCLAAALRFKLGGVDGGVPSYGTVVLDEAFTKTDNEFTATSMQIFTELGFQMIVATPLKSVMTLEPFVGGATYVSIANRHTSSVLNISYDTATQRLALSPADRAVTEAPADETA